jgi:ribonuclease R
VRHRQPERERRGHGREPREAAAGDGSSGGVVVAVVEKHGRFLSATPFFERGRRINVDKPRPGTGGPGDLVLVKLNGPQSAHGRVVRRLGRPDVARDVIEALMLHRGLRRRFDPVVERAAREAAETVGERELRSGRRLDLRDLTTFTIDPPTAKDFDDAISAELLADGAVHVWVHIADVAAHVPPGSPVDREAYRRATSVYVPGAVEPMLPEDLSNRACSLVPDEDRLAVTVELELDGPRVRRSAFHRTIIRSDARLDYPQVDRIFSGIERAEEPWGVPLAAARHAAAALQRAREARGALEVESVEPEFGFSRDGHVTALEPTQQTEAHRLIEHLMIAANEAVATLLEARKAPTLYRVHERPEPARVEHLVEQLASLDVPTPPLPKPMTPQQAGVLVAEISRMVAEEVRRRHGRGRLAFTSLVLRTLKQAHYSPRNLGHHGLGSAAYCHFTSPIRRYPDLVAHRALLAAVGAGEDPPPAARMEESGTWCSQRERDAMAIERTADSVAGCFVLEAELFRHGWEAEFDGEVTGIIGAGAFVEFGEGQDGLLPVRRLGSDWWEVNELQTMLIGSESSRAIRLGDPIRVRVARVDAPRGRVDLVPVELPPE